MSLIPVAPTLGSLFVQSWQIYRVHLFPLLGLTLVPLVPALLLSLSEDQGESVVFFLLMRLLEAGATLGLLSYCSRAFFPLGRFCADWAVALSYDLCTSESYNTC